MATKKVLRKIIKNNVEYRLPEGGSGGGGGLDTPSTLALIDTKLGNFDTLFQLESGLYKMLNDYDSEDELGLSSGETWSDIVSDETSMNKISHSYSVMTLIANSEVALNGVCGSSIALNELMECWNSCFVLSKEPLAFNILTHNQSALDEILNSSISWDAFFSDENIARILIDSYFTTADYEAFYDNQYFADKVYNNNELLLLASNNSKSYNALVESDIWSDILSDVNKLGVIMISHGEDIIDSMTSEELWEDNMLRAIIKGGKLDYYLQKDDRAYNGIISFEVDSISDTTFKIARYGYNAATSTWKWSLDGGVFNSVSVAASTTPLSINLQKTGKHIVVVKPATYAVGWARQMGNRNSTNYWNNDISSIRVKIKNLPGFAFITSPTTLINYFLYFAFYGFKSLYEVDMRIPSTCTSAGSYCYSNTFNQCSNLEKITGVINGINITTIGDFYLYYSFSYCSKLEKLPDGFDLSTITSSMGRYFLGYAFNQCSKLKALPKGFRLPSIGYSSNYMTMTFGNCSSLSNTAPTEPITIVCYADNCFYNVPGFTASPSAGTTVQIHRE